MRFHLQGGWRLLVYVFEMLAHTYLTTWHKRVGHEGVWGEVVGQLLSFLTSNADVDESTRRSFIFVRLGSHCICIWPIVYTDIHCRQRQNKQMRFSKWRRSQWLRAAPTCTDMFRRMTVETKSFCFFPAVYASASCSFVLSTQMSCISFFILEENG